MTFSVIILPILLILFIVFAEKVNIRVRSFDITVIDVNFNVFAIQLTSKENSSASRKRTKFKRRKFLSSLVLRIISKGELRINSLSVFLPKKEPSINAFRIGIYSSLIYSLIAYAAENTSFFEAKKINIEYSDHNNFRAFFDASITIDLFKVLLCIFEILGEKIHYKSYQKTR